MRCFCQVQSGQNYHVIAATGQSLSTGCQGYASGQVTSGSPYSNLSLSPGGTAIEGTNGATVATISQASGPAPASPTISSGGSGYTTPPLVIVTGDGTGGAYTANLTGGVVSSLTRTSAGSGYTTVSIYMTWPPSAPNARQLDTAPLIALAPTWACNNGGGDSTDPSQLPQEYPSLSAVNQLTYMTGGSTGLKYILALHGVSGRLYGTSTSLGGIGGPTDVPQPSPNPSFWNWTKQLSAIQTAVTAASGTYQTDAVILTHGESDGAAYNWLYDQNLNHLQWDYETQVATATGRIGTLPLFIDQANSWGFYHGAGATPTSELRMWTAAENNPGRIYLIGPIYQFPSGALGDGVHKSPAGYRAMGELYGKAMYQVLVQHQYWTPVMPKSITVSGSTITAQFFVPAPPLQFDTTTVSAQPNKGFEFTDRLTAVVYRITQASGPAPASPTIAFGGSGYTNAPTVTINGCSGAAYTANLTNGIVTSLTRTSAGSGCVTIDILFSTPAPSVSISSVTISGPDTVTITLSGTPTGPSPTLRYAYTAPVAVAGGEGNLKDSDTSTGRTGSALFDWCVTFSAPIPFMSNLLRRVPGGGSSAVFPAGVIQ
ncbi:MAG TPA: hypothetical protein VGL82_22315 [Bryobacteraceae bacterium]